MIWHKLYLDECGHLQRVAELLLKYEGKEWKSIFTCGGDFPELLKLGENIDYVRKVIKNTVYNTACMEDYCNVNDLPDDTKFFEHNEKENGDDSEVASHLVIQEYIYQKGKDYRYEVAKHPIPELAIREDDNTTVGRQKTK